MVGSLPLETPRCHLLDNKKIILIFLLAIVIRIVWALLAPHLDPFQINHPLPGDSSGYDLLANNLLRGYGFTWDGVQPTSYRMPGFPLFLAGIYMLLGHNLVAVRLIQAILGAALCLPVYAISRQFTGEFTALLAALGVAIYPTLIYMSGWIYSETLYILLLWLGIWLLLTVLIQKRDEKIAYRLALFTGVGGLWGAATYVRPETFPLPLVILGFVLIAQATGIISSQNINNSNLKIIVSGLLITQVTMVFLILPWTIRNSSIYQAFVPLTTSAGSNLYAGNNPLSQGGSAWVVPLAGISELASDRQLAVEARQWIIENPGAAAKNELQKLGRFFSPFELETQSSPFGRWRLVINAIYAIFLFIAAFGFYRSWRQEQPVFRLYPIVLLALITWYLITALIFFGGSRVALPIVPAIIIFAAYGILQIFHRK